MATNDRWCCQCRRMRTVDVCGCGARTHAPPRRIYAVQHTVTNERLDELAAAAEARARSAVVGIGIPSTR